MRHHRSLRVQVTVITSAIVAAVVVVAGLTIAWRINGQDRAQVDALLEDRAAKIVEDLAKDGTAAIDRDKTGVPAGNDSLLAGSATIVRLISGGTISDQRGPEPAVPIPIPDRAGFSDLELGGQTWRSLVADVDSIPGARVQLLQDLSPVEDRLNDNRVLIALVTTLALTLAAAVTWLIMGRMLRPLQDLRSAAHTIRAPIDTDYRLPEPDGPIEVRDLAVTLNSMLARLETSMNATRRFAGDAGHELRTPLTALGFDLETMREHPELADNQRRAMLEAMAVQYDRLSHLLDGLLALARGDAEALPSKATIDMSDLLQQSVTEARRRHPGIDLTLTEVVTGAHVDGWHEGMRLAVDNLIDNAARHGGPVVHIDITLDRSGPDAITVQVLDDGPGVPDHELDVVTQRFARGGAVQTQGSGLGLAIAQQQAHLHGGDLELGPAPTGGLAATITIPAAPGSDAPTVAVDQRLSRH